MANPVRKTLSYLGLVDDEPLYVEEQPHMEYVTPARRAAYRFTPSRRPNQSDNHIVTVHPEKYSDAKTIAENFRMDIPVIVNVKNMEIEEAKRLLDFCGGLIMGLDGKIEKITSKVFLLSPHSVAVTSQGDPNVTGEIDTTFFGE